MSKKDSLNTLKVAIGGILLTLCINYIFAAWTPPTQNPPLQDSLLVPLNEGTDIQQKTGMLIVGGLAITPGRLTIPSTAQIFALDILLWLGGKARADDFCLNSNPATCLSTAGAGGGSAGKLIFSGQSALAGNFSRCHPTAGFCGSTGSVTDQLGLTVPFAMTLKNLSATVKDAPNTSACQFKIAKKAGPCKGSGGFDPSSLLFCTITGTGVYNCSNSSETLSLVANDCIQLQINMTSGSCPNSNQASWSFEGDY